MEREHLPKSIRQMGDRDRNFRIYMEDYVHTFIRKSLVTGGEELAVGLLLGGTVELNGETPCFIPGALDAPAAIRDRGEIFLNENVWDELMKRKEQYFPDLEVCGWYVRGGEEEIPDLRQLNQIHQKWFSAYGSVLYVSSGNDGYFLVGGGAGLVPVRGYYVYYERNLEMQDYMILVRRGVGSEQESCPGVKNQAAVPATDNNEAAERATDRKNEEKTGGENKTAAGEHHVIDVRTKKRETEAGGQGEKATTEAASADFDTSKQEKGEDEKEENSLGGFYRFGLGLVAVLAIVFAVSVTGNGGLSKLMERFVVEVGQSGEVQGNKQGGQASQPEGSDQAANADAPASLEGENQKKPISITIIPGNVTPVPEESSKEEQSSQEESVQVDATLPGEESGEASVSGGSEETEPVSISPEPAQEPSESVSLPTENESLDSSSQSLGDTEPVDGKPVYQEHLVLSGETLLGICIECYGDGSRMEEICEINGIEDRDYIYEGQIILLP